VCIDLHQCRTYIYVSDFRAAVLIINWRLGIIIIIIICCWWYYLYNNANYGKLRFMVGCGVSDDHIAYYIDYIVKM